MVSICSQPSGVAYPSSKYAVNGLTWSLARELGPFHIRVNAVAPGITRTDMVAALPKEMIEPLVNRIPLRRIGEAEDMISQTPSSSWQAIWLRMSRVKFFLWMER